MIQTVCVFCGSKDGSRPVYRQAATDFGVALAQHHLDLVYGGAGAGLMGAVADAALAGGRKVTGIIPWGLARQEFAHPGLTESRFVESMHQRKGEMAALSDAFVALPGGFGTLDELFEALTWAQLGLHRKPLGLLNVDGYFDPLLAWMRRGFDEGFIPRGLESALLVDAAAGPLIERLLIHQPPPPAVQWMTPERR